MCPKAPLQKTAAIILAAGASRRLGQPKQLVMYDGQTLLERTVSSAIDSSAGVVIVVLGENAAQFQALLEPYPALIVDNRLWKAGISSSIKAGVNALTALTEKESSPDSSFDSALFLTCDQPYVSAQLLSELIARFRVSESRIVASAYADCLGIPAVFDRTLFPELLELKGDSGARSLIREYRDTVATIAFPQGDVDIDTQADLAHLLDDK